MARERVPQGARRAGSAVAAVAALLLASGPLPASTVIGLSVEDQARLAAHVVSGQVVAQRGVDHPANGLETEVTFRVRAAYKGGASRGDTLVFITRGGELDGVISVAVGEADFRVGQQALVFLEEIEGRLHTLGLSMGVWDVQQERSGRAAYTRALRDGLEIVGDVEIERGPIPAAAMRARVQKTLAHPDFDHPLLGARVDGGR